MDADQLSSTPETDRLLETIVRLFAITTPELRPALTQASNLVAEALGADKVDVFLHEVASNSLVALGTSETPMGRKQHELGLDRLPVANGSPPAQVFLSGEPYLSGRIDQDQPNRGGWSNHLGYAASSTWRWTWACNAVGCWESPARNQIASPSVICAS